MRNVHSLFTPLLIIRTTQHSPHSRVTSHNLLTRSLFRCRYQSCGQPQKSPGRSKTSVLTLLNFISESHLTDYTGKRFPLALTAHNPSKFFVSLCEVDKDKDIPEYLALLPFAAFNALNSIHFWGRGLMF